MILLGASRDPITSSASARPSALHPRDRNAGAFLASDAASGITDVALYVDGGASAAI
jgi:enoyl-[acyl-carrier-protein] reductase (NADH)